MFRVLIVHDQQLKSGRMLLQTDAFQGLRLQSATTDLQCS
jgi:hypothetical protein